MQRPYACFFQKWPKGFRDTDNRTPVPAVDAFHDSEVKTLFCQRGNRFEHSFFHCKSCGIISGKIVAKGRSFLLSCRECAAKKSTVRSFPLKNFLDARNAAEIHADTFYHKATPSDRFFLSEV